MDTNRFIVDPETSVEIEVPDFASVESALAKERRRRAGKILSLTLSPDHGCVVPLWSGGEPVADLDALMLPEEVRLALLRWQQRWEEQYDLEIGWRSEAARRAWLIDGEAVFDRLSVLLWESADVIPDFRRMG